MATGVILTFWLRNYVEGWKSTLLWIGIMLTLANTSRLFTPDAFTCALTVFAMWLILEQRLYWWGMSVLLLTVWARPDYILLVAILGVALWLVNRLSRADTLILTGMAIGSYACLTHYSGNYGWLLLMQHSFIFHLKAPGEFVVNPATVLSHYPNFLLLATINSGRLAPIVLAVTYAVGGFLLLHKPKCEFQAALAAILVFGVAHVLIYPSLELRFFGPATVIVSMSVTRYITKRRQPSEHAKEICHLDQLST